MNSEATALDLTRTTYTDPSGYEPTTVSTALDQLKLAQLVLANSLRPPGYKLRAAQVVANLAIESVGAPESETSGTVPPGTGAFGALAVPADRVEATASSAMPAPGVRWRVRHLLG